ncbi:MAG: SPOR domain-containing protein [Pseudomonadota bacterium]
MRFLTSFCGLLLLANVAVLFWPDDARTAPHIYVPKADLNPHFVRLNKEIEDRYYEPNPAIITTSDSEQLMAADGAGEGGCFRLGPFMHKANYELAQAVLFNANISFQKSTRASKESNVFRVYLGPFESAAEATDTRVELRRKSILDHFVRKEADNQYIVSLGIYTTEETAVRAVNLFDGKLDSVQLKEELVVLPDSYWLHFDSDDGGRIRQQLARMDWGEQSARLGRYECQSVLLE